MRDSLHGTVGWELVAAARGAVWLAVGIIVLVFVGHLVTKAVVQDGVADLRSPEERDIAEAVVVGAWLLIDNPIQRLYRPAVRVTAIQRDPGHCPAPGGSATQYRGELRAYTLFAIPAGTIYFTCGGREMGWR